MIRLGLSAVGLVAMLVAAVPAARAQDFPTRQVTIVVGLAPGGITDISARIYADALSKGLGQRVVVENRQGAGGAVGAAAVQNAPARRPYGADLFRLAAHGGAGDGGVQPYEPLKGFAPVTLLFHLATLVTVPAELPAKDLAGLFALGNRREGR